MRGVLWMTLLLGGPAAALLYSNIQSGRTAQLEADLQAETVRLEELQRLLERHAPLLRQEAQHTTPRSDSADLQKILSDAAARYGLDVADLSRSRAQDGKARTHSMAIRRARHGDLIRFLIALDREAPYADVREIRIDSPSKSTDRYDDIHLTWSESIETF